MTAWIVDASVAVKWFVPEIYSNDATQLLIEGNELAAPELLLAEIGNILWKKHRIGELRVNEARGILADFKQKWTPFIGQVLQWNLCACHPAIGIVVSPE